MVVKRNLHEKTKQTVLASVAAFGLGTYLRKFNVNGRNGKVDRDAYEGPRCDVYRSKGFLKGLLLASVPLSLSEHFNDVSDHIEQNLPARLCFI